MSRKNSIDDVVSTLIGAVMFSAVIAGIAVGYHPLPSTQSRAAATVTPSPLPSPSCTAPPTKQPTATRTQPPTATPTATPEPTPTPVAPQDHYWFARPIAADGVNFISRFYPYGSTYGGRYQVHHGVEFENPTGTLVLAAGPGRVVVAGPDDLQVYGRFPDFYGQLVVIEHNRTWVGQPIYTLYGHLSTTLVEPGQQIQAGQIIGAVGATGIALGPHLHMEVRVGRNSYDATRNPELWIRPFDGYGTIAGRLLDSEGNPIQGAVVTLYDGQGAWNRDTETYGEGANPDEGWQENFVFGDVPAGTFKVQYTIDDHLYTRAAEVAAGKTTLVTLIATHLPSKSLLTQP